MPQSCFTRLDFNKSDLKQRSNIKNESGNYLANYLLGNFRNTSNSLLDNVTYSDSCQISEQNTSTMLTDTYSRVPNKRTCTTIFFVQISRLCDYFF